VVVTVPITAVRAIFAVPLCLVLPGYALTSAAFARRSVTRAHMLMLTVAMSLSILAIGSLVLQLVPGGLRTASWTVLLLFVVIGGSAIAARRRRPVADRRWPDLPPRPRLLEAALLVIAGLGTAAAFALAKTPLPARNVIGYTQLWMLRAGSASQPGVHIGVASAETGSIAYRLELVAEPDHAPIQAVASFQFALRPGQQFERVVPIATFAPSGSQRVVAHLYRRDQPYAVYRYVLIRISDSAQRSP
jgi:hypothetical protein